MSKTVIAFILISVHAQVSAAAAPAEWIEIIRTTHLGGTLRDVVELKQKGFAFNGNALPTVTAPAYARALHTLRPRTNAPSARAQLCPDGVVELKRRKAGRQTAEKFCFSDKRTAEVVTALNVLRAQAQLAAASN